MDANGARALADRLKQEGKDDSDYGADVHKKMLDLQKEKRESSSSPRQ